MTTEDSAAKKRVTLDDIAQRANVSKSTVSRALNGYRHVDPATRDTIWKTAEALDYPLESLRRSNDTLTVALLARDNALEAGSEIYMLASIERVLTLGVQSVLEPRSISTCMRRTRMLPEDAQSFADDPGIDGLILLGGIVEPDFVRALQATKLPFVIAGAHAKPLEVNCVMADVGHGIEQAVDHLVTIGRTRVGLVNGTSNTRTSEAKYKMLRLALHLRGLSFSPQQVVESDFTSESGYTQTAQLLSRVPDLDAIIYADDIVAMGGLRALKESGRSIPGDIAVVGFHDYELAKFTDPPLTSVHFDMRKMGIIAARRICMMMEETDDEAWYVVIPTALVVRGSTVASGPFV